MEKFPVDWPLLASPSEYSNGGNQQRAWHVLFTLRFQGVARVVLASITIRTVALRVCAGLMVRTIDWFKLLSLRSGYENLLSH